MILAKIFESLKAYVFMPIYLPHSVSFSCLFLLLVSDSHNTLATYLSSFLDSTEQLDFFLISAFLFSIKMCLFCGAAAESILLYFLLPFGWLVDLRLTKYRSFWSSDSYWCCSSISRYVLNTFQKIQTEKILCTLPHLLKKVVFYERTGWVLDILCLLKCKEEIHIHIHTCIYSRIWNIYKPIHETYSWI